MGHRGKRPRQKGTSARSEENLLGLPSRRRTLDRGIGLAGNRRRRGSRLLRDCRRRSGRLALRARKRWRAGEQSPAFAYLWPDTERERRAPLIFLNGYRDPLFPKERENRERERETNRQRGRCAPFPAGPHSRLPFRTSLPATAHGYITPNRIPIRQPEKSTTYTIWTFLAGIRSSNEPSRQRTRKTGLFRRSQGNDQGNPLVRGIALNGESTSQRIRSLRGSRDCVWGDESESPKGQRTRPISNFPPDLSLFSPLRAPQLSV